MEVSGKINKHVTEALLVALYNLMCLSLLATEADKYVFVIDSDWANGHVGYMLFAQKNGEERPVDIGSKMFSHRSSSYLGELDAIQWACWRTKAFGGSILLIIYTNSHNIIDKAKSKNIHDSDVCGYQRWAWLIANELGFEIQFVPGAENIGADFLSRLVKNQQPGIDTLAIVEVASVQNDVSNNNSLVFFLHLKENSDEGKTEELEILVPHMTTGDIMAGIVDDDLDCEVEEYDYEALAAKFGELELQETDKCYNFLTIPEMEAAVWDEHLKAHWEPLRYTIP